MTDDEFKKFWELFAHMGFVDAWGSTEWQQTHQELREALSKFQGKLP